MTDALARQQQPAALALRSAQEIAARTHLVREVLEAVMKVGVHYGTVPGTDKPSLWQAGADKLLMTFHFSCEPGIVEDLSTAEEVAYRVRADVREIRTGLLVASGLGFCTSREEKYRWKKATKEQYEAAPADRRRTKVYAPKGGKSGWTAFQIATDAGDVANTVMQMAYKRAKVSATRTACAASDVFDQDLEDLAEAGLLDDEPQARPVSQPKAKAPAPSSPTARPAAAPTTDDGPPDDGAPPIDVEVLDEPPAPRASERQPGEDAAPAARQDPTTSQIPVAAWKAIQGVWHTNGTISEPQQKRLFAKALSAGWSKSQISKELELGLGLGLEDVAHGRPYDLLVAAFEKFAPGK